MKVALVVDFLISKNHYTKVIESFIQLYQDCELFALVHTASKTSKFIEQKKITSSFLSGFVKEEKDLNKYVYLFQAAAKSLTIPCNFSKIIFISSGFVLNINYCKDIDIHFYQYNDPFAFDYQNAKGLLNKFFRAYIFSQVDQAIAKFKTKKIGDNITPPLIVKQFKKISDNFDINKNIISINLSGVAQDDLLKIKNYIKNKKDIDKFVFWSTNYQVLDIAQFFEIEHCNYIHYAGEIIPSLHATSIASSKIIIDLSRSYWPELALIAIQMQKNVVISSFWRGHDYFKRYNTIDDLLVNNKEQLEDDMSLFCQSSESDESAQLFSMPILDNIGFKRKIKNELSS